VGQGRGICPAIKEDGAEKTVATDLPFDETNCLLCGQCVLACPVAALQEKSEIEKVKDALADESKHVIVAIAPAVRTALGELFGMPLGTDVTGKIYTALRELGFNKVFDINFAADVTIMEEGTELLQRLGVVEGGHGEPKFPMYTSCCPGWVRLVDNYAPELYGNISSAKSPQQIFGAASKYYYPKVSGVEAKDVYTVTIMPCTAKKFEAQRDGMYGASGDPENRDIDAVLTTRELAEMIKKTKNPDGKKIDFANLEDGVADPSMGEYTGAGTIFGVSGGVMEAALRTAADLASGQSIDNVDYEAVEGFDGVREATVPLTLKDGSVINLEVAVVNGAANFFKLRDEGDLNKYHFIEVMVCLGGCINGGGQPHVNSHDKLDYAVGKDSCPLSGHFAGTGDFLPEFVLKRASVLRKQDRDGKFTDRKRKSHENAEVQKMYETLGVEPSQGIAHELFHVDYS
ncbi:MAG: [FeFe] hydrogenase, group A, partial [Candidatus Ancillula sp.]|nr:[FeFe] hydrogenase, group A [Candidatus Ancillula sp.]